ncbi:probable C-mannosyltransferase DPY19L1 [Pieris napi]|uniref:probable C-mannosyltransferase DPY19L1 n=1 Tax=Pieris napi TaxID=78633 RepID=UPI001FB9887D|nr:probable C-mannosyltransferase DPY19L1 [Pieris napi]
MEENTERPKEMKFFFAFIKTIKALLLIFLIYIVSNLHSKYVNFLFENDRNFLYLSDLEREMSFRTEMGFYYSYYKTVVEEKPFVAGISKLMYDRIVEYPKEVNAFNRFNIHPEVLVGALYRYLAPWLNTTTYRQCHIIHRGEGHDPVESCVGLGHPIFFYLEAVWIFAGINVAALFLHALELSESYFGGGLAVLQYFANHAECTRVHWAPNERENFAGPLLLLQTYLLTIQIHDKRNTVQLQIGILLLNCLCLLFWQFTQFIFLTQIAIFFLMEQLRVIETRQLSILLHSHYCGLHMAILLLQGNEMLKSSLYVCLFLVVSTYCLFFSGLRIKVKNRFDFLVESWLVILRVAIVICGSISLKKIISDFLEVEEDTHVWEILFSKFTDYKTFHTMMYTCSEVFDFLPLSSIINMTKTFLIPYVLFGVINAVYFWINKSKTENVHKGIEEERLIDDEDSGIENNEANIRKEETDLDVLDKEKDNTEKDNLIQFLSGLSVDAAVFYNISQMVVYGVMAALVMRLKLLFTTQMCLMSSLVFKKKYYIYPHSVMKYLVLILIVGIIPMLSSLVNNVSKEMSHEGEFSDYNQEELLLWLKQQGPGAVAGSMPLLATIMLTTKRPIVAHPHYEHLEARQRAYTVYKMYGRFSPHELYQELSKLRATYLVVETKYCYGRSSKGCSLTEIWDLESPKNRESPPLCDTLLTTTVDHFYPLFRNAHYAVFRIHDLSVRYMPRSFDT